MIKHNAMVQDVVIEFKEPRKMDGIRWYILVGKSGNRLRVIKDANVDMLFTGGNAGLLSSGYPTSEHLMESDEIELTICTAYVNGETDGLDWDTLAEHKVRELGTMTTMKVLIPRGEIVEFCDAASSEMVQKGECRWVELCLGDKVLTSFVSSGKNLWFYLFDNQVLNDYDNR